MDINRFWSIVDAGRASAKGDQERMLASIRKTLGALPPDDIASFGAHLDESVVNAYRWDLWGAAYIMSGGCSDDGFEYFRYWLVAMGRDVYEKAMANPESLADVKIELVEDESMIEFESFGCIAREVYEARAGKEMPFAAKEQPREPTGEAWVEDGDDLRRRFPRLWKRFGH